MTSPRKVDNLNPMRHKVLKYLREHPQEFQYIVGDYLAVHPEIRKKISEKNKKRGKLVLVKQEEPPSRKLNRRPLCSLLAFQLWA